MSIPSRVPKRPVPRESPAADDAGPVDPGPTAEDTPGTNATQHLPNPREVPIPDPGAEHKYHPESPYTAGNY